LAPRVIEVGHPLSRGEMQCAAAIQHWQTSLASATHDCRFAS
jgi:hypothetical protein